MNWLDFRSLPLWTNLLIFTVAAGTVWFAGTRLARYAEAISERTGLGRAFIGALLLGGITSLPEVVTAATASAIGNASLAVNNLFGAVALQVSILVAADAVVPGRALSAVTAHPAVLLQGALLVLVLAVAIAGILVGDVSTLPFGLWTLLLFIMSVFGFYRIQRHETHQRWRPIMGARERRRDQERERKGKRRARTQPLSVRRLVVYTIATAVAILLAGYALARTGDALAAQTGLGSGFVGVALLAISTSLPELSTTLAAARLGQFDMAFSNVYGANLLDVGILFLADLVYAGGPVLNEMGRLSILGAVLGIAVTTVYLVGLIERRHRTLWRLGLDSLVVLVIYLAGLYALYTLR